VKSHCFIANYHLTPLQIALGNRLRAEGVPIVFIAVNQHLYDDIIASGWDRRCVLYLPFDATPEDTPFKEVPIKFFDLIAADRALRFEQDKALHYLYRSARMMMAFFREHSVSFVLSEPTWAHERLAAAICAQISGMTFLTPFTVRYPQNRWAFFPNGDQVELFEVAKQPNFSSSPETSTSTEVLQEGPPSYLRRNNELLAEARTFRARLSRLGRFITRERIDPRDPTHIQSRLRTLLIKGGEEINRILYKVVERTPLSDALVARPFVLYALHKQPESSIDVLGRYYEDQEVLIHAIWRTLPTGWRLYVKEHTNAIGDRSPAFYRRVASPPGIELIDECIPIGALMPHARAVFSVSGTVAYEAAMSGIPSFTFAPMFFNAFPSCNRITVDDLREAEDIAALIPSTQHASEHKIESILSRVEAQSFPGRFTDVVTDPHVLDAENLDKLVRGFLMLDQNF